MKEQTQELHYYEYCIGRGFDTIKDTSWEYCSQCGDIQSSYIFSFKDREEFIEKYTYEMFLCHYQDEEGSLSREQLIAKCGEIRWEHTISQTIDTYEELLEELEDRKEMN